MPIKHAEYYLSYLCGIVFRNFAFSSFTFWESLYSAAADYMTTFSTLIVTLNHSLHDVLFSACKIVNYTAPISDLTVSLSLVFTLFLWR